MTQDSDTAATIMAALDAAVAALHVAAAPDMPRGAVPEEALEQACGLLRHHLLHNVLAFHDARLQQLHRPNLLTAGEEHALPVKCLSTRSCSGT